MSEDSLSCDAVVVEHLYKSKSLIKHDEPEIIRLEN